MANKPLPYTPLVQSNLSPRNEIARSLAPLVAVAASPDVDEICQANNIPSFADFIQPFGDTIEGRITSRDAQGVPIPIDNFNIRFRSIDKLDEPDYQAVQHLVNDTVKVNSTSPIEPHFIRNRLDVTESYLDTALDDMMPWYTSFKRLIFSLRGITEHETFDHPVAIMMVISSVNPDPMGAIMQLYNPNVPSFTVDKPYVDTNILRFYVLIHDPQQTTLEHSQEIFEKMKKSFGLHCHMLALSSRPQTSFEGNHHAPNNNNDMVENDVSIRRIWQDYLEKSSAIDISLQRYCQLLSNSDSQQQQQQEHLLTHNDLPSSPSIPSLTRSSSSSSIATNPSSSTPPVFTGATAQTFDLTSMSLDQPMSSIEDDPLVNSNNDDDNDQLLDAVSTLVSSSSSTSTSAVKYGQYLSQENVEKTKVMVKELVTQSIIPFMERNIQHWNEQVAAGRRGLTGRLFGASRRLFGTSTSRNPSPQSIQTIPAYGRNVPAGTNTLTIYPYGAPEAQMRKLADYAFMLRDYKFAQVIYDTVRRDYATDKAYKYHAGTQEMIGICLLMMNQPLTSKVDVDRNFELAIQQYLGRCRSPYHATRTTVMYYELLKSRRMWKEIPTALVRMTGEDSDLRSALFLEQAAHCFLRAPRPMIRKYSFHLVMAGHRYAKASQRMHALRCYKLASLILDDNQWSVAKSHVQFALGRQSFHLGRLDDTVSHFANVLPDAKQTPPQQIAHIREFLFIYQQYATRVGIDPLKETLPDLGIPIIDDKNIRVSSSNAPQDADNQDEWATMERALLEANIEKGFILKSKKALALQQQDDNRVICAVSEPSTVRVELFNPLQVAVNMSEIILGCKYRDSIHANKDSLDTNQFIDEGMIYGTPVHGTTDLFRFDDFDLQKIPKVSLDPLERRVLNLVIVPRKEGSITIVGVHYTFNDLVHTFRPFHKKGKRLNTTKEERTSTVYAPDRSLDILVTPPMPLLDLTFHNVPETILSGEVVQAVMEINNKGNKGLTSLRLKSNNPSFICVGHPEQVDKHIYDSNVKDDDNQSCKNQIYDPSIISIPLPSEGNQKTMVQSGKTTLVPFWIRGDRIGKYTLKLLFSYQSEEENSAIAHRTLRYTLHIQVTPSLKINAFTRPSMTVANEFILGVEIENLQSSTNFDLRQLTAVSALWNITPLSVDLNSERDILDKTTIPSRQTTFGYYKIRPSASRLCASRTSPEAWTSDALGKLLNNNDNFDPPPPIDLTITKIPFRKEVISYNTIPLKNFALCSRVNWRTSHLQSQYPTISTEKQARVFTLYNTSDIDLTLYWDIPNLNRHGHHYIIGVNLGIAQNPYQQQYSSQLGIGKERGSASTYGTGRTLFEATQKERTALVHSLTRNLAVKEEGPVKLVIQSRDSIKHDFTENDEARLLKVPVTITLKNCSWNKQASYSLELLSWTEGKHAQQQKASMKSALDIHAFHWTGATCFSGLLKNDESTAIEALAVFQRTGVYDINRWKLTVHTSSGNGEDDGGVFVHCPSLAHIVTVT